MLEIFQPVRCVISYPRNISRTVRRDSVVSGMLNMLIERTPKETCGKNVQQTKNHWRAHDRLEISGYAVKSNRPGELEPDIKRRGYTISPVYEEKNKAASRLAG